MSEIYMTELRNLRQFCVSDKMWLGKPKKRGRNRGWRTMKRQPVNDCHIENFMDSKSRRNGGRGCGDAGVTSAVRANGSTCKIKGTHFYHLQLWKKANKYMLVQKAHRVSWAEQTGWSRAQTPSFAFFGLQPSSGVWMCVMHCEAARIWRLRKDLIRMRGSQSTFPSRPPKVSDLTAPKAELKETSWSVFELRRTRVESGDAMRNVAIRQLVMRHTHTQRNGRCCGHRAIGVPELCIYGKRYYNWHEKQNIICLRL